MCPTATGPVRAEQPFRLDQRLGRPRRRLTHGDRRRVRSGHRMGWPRRHLTHADAPPGAEARRALRLAAWKGGPWGWRNRPLDEWSTLARIARHVCAGPCNESRSFGDCRCGTPEAVCRCGRHRRGDLMSVVANRNAVVHGGPAARDVRAISDVLRELEGREVSLALADGLRLDAVTSSRRDEVARLLFGSSRRASMSSCRAGPWTAWELRSARGCRGGTGHAACTQPTR